MSLEVTSLNVEKEVLNKKGLTVLDFWAEWCGPCRMLGPIIDELSKDEVNNDVVIGKINVDENPELSGKYGIRSIPTIIFLKDGVVVDKLIGGIAKNVLQDKINSLK
jgi:thioredoxin 1